MDKAETAWSSTAAAPPTALAPKVAAVVAVAVTVAVAACIAAGGFGGRSFAARESTKAGAAVVVLLLLLKFWEEEGASVDGSSEPLRLPFTCNGKLPDMVGRSIAVVVDDTVPPNTFEVTLLVRVVEHSTTCRSEWLVAVVAEITRLRVGSGVNPSFTKVEAGGSVDGTVPAVFVVDMDNVGTPKGVSES